MDEMIVVLKDSSEADKVVIEEPSFLVSFDDVITHSIIEGETIVHVLVEQQDIVVIAQPAGEGISDHGLLTGLMDDDHLQYIIGDRADWAELTGGGETALHTHPVTGGLTVSTPVPLTGTGVTFALTKTGVKRLTINIDNMQTTGTSLPVLQLRAGGLVEATGYKNTVARILGGTAVESSVGHLLDSVHVATLVERFSVTFILQDPSINQWLGSHITGRSSPPSAQVEVGSTVKALAAALDGFRITTLGGTDTFVSGSVSFIEEN